MEEMTHYRILGRNKYYNTTIRLKNDEKVVEIGSKYTKNNFVYHPLMDLSCSIFSLLRGEQETYVSRFSGSKLCFSNIEKEVSTEEALISGFGLKKPMKVNESHCKPIEDFSDRKLSGFEEIKKHPYKLKTVESVDQDLYEKWNKIEQKKILDEKSELIGVKIPEEEMNLTISSQNLPALEFLKEVSDSYKIYPKGAYLWLNRKDGKKTHALLKLKGGSEEILIKTCPMLAMSYCSGETTEIYGRLA